MDRINRAIYHACLVLSLVTVQVRAGFWSVSIDESPAPLPEDGPPFSAHASRNRALLPAQICGIVGAYFASVFLLGSLLLTVGRRLRQSAQSSHGTLAMEMVRPTMRNFDPSPVSPVSTQRSWYSPQKGRKKKTALKGTKQACSAVSPKQCSISSFDTNVLDADKASRQQEMERLYAAVMAQEERKSQSIISENELNQSEGIGPHDPRPLRLLTLAPALALPNATTGSADHGIFDTPRSPVRAIYPPGLSIPSRPISPTLPSPVGYPTCPTHRQMGARHADGINHRRSRTSPVGSQRLSAIGAQRTRRSRRKLQISAPMMRYPGDSGSDGAHTPLSPRLYLDPGAPPSPPTGSEAPSSPGTSTFGYGLDEEGDEDLPQLRDLQPPAPQRHGSYHFNIAAHLDPNAQKSVLPRAALTLNTNSVSTAPALEKAETSGTSRQAAQPSGSSPAIGPLPFRTMSNTRLAAPLPSPSVVTKTTYLERRRDILAVNGLRTGLATPYSPYMPFTPITPVTPHLTSRRERKQLEKDAGRRVLGQQDAVIDKKEMWGGGY